MSNNGLVHACPNYPDSECLHNNDVYGAPTPVGYVPVGQAAPVDQLVPVGRVTVSYGFPVGQLVPVGQLFPVGQLVPMGKVTVSYGSPVAQGAPLICTCGVPFHYGQNCNCGPNMNHKPLFGEVDPSYYEAEDRAKNKTKNKGKNSANNNAENTPNVKPEDKAKNKPEDKGKNKATVEPEDKPHSYSDFDSDFDCVDGNEKGKVV